MIFPPHFIHSDTITGGAMAFKQADCTCKNMLWMSSGASVGPRSIS